MRDRLKLKQMLQTHLGLHYYQSSKTSVIFHVQFILATFYKFEILLVP